MPHVELKAYQAVCDDCREVGNIVIVEKAFKGFAPLPQGWKRIGATVMVTGLGLVLDRITLVCGECQMVRSVSKPS